MNYANDFLTDEDKDNFFNIAESLKKHRRADLSDVIDNDNAIEKLYVDFLENNQILKETLKSNTTFLIGRKGTGKSTIIGRFQYEIRKKPNVLSLYIDVKKVHDLSANIDESIIIDYQNITKTDYNYLKKYLLYKNFLTDILKEIKTEIKNNTANKIRLSIQKLNPFNKEIFEQEIDSLINNLDNTDKQQDIKILTQRTINTTSSDKQGHTLAGELRGSVDLNKVGVSAGATGKFSSENNECITQEYSEIFIKYFDLKNFIQKIKNVLKPFNINRIYICLDDFSEIEEDSMKIFVDTIIAPLNNWTDEFIKFKICAYPGRIYFGDMDPIKIDQINLDYYNLYSTRMSKDMEKEAIAYTKRLLDNRCNIIAHKPFSHFIDTERYTENYFYETIFHMTSNVPRNLGWLLFYTNRKTISKGKRITIQDLKTSIQEYYNEIIKPYTSSQRFIKQTYEEQLKNYQVNELFNVIINCAKNNKSEVGKSTSDIFKDYDINNAPTSFFYVSPDYEKLLESLELNFFITKYSEQNGQDGNKKSFYWINYGACEDEKIIFGKGNSHKYIVQRRFDYTQKIHEYINNLKFLECSNCGATYQLEKEESLKMFDMLCPNCKQGYCSKKTVDIVLPKKIREENLLSSFEYNLLNILRVNERPLFASLIAADMDCYYQKISRKSISLKNKGLLIVEENNYDKKYNTKYGVRNYYYLTEKAIEIYFRENS